MVNLASRLCASAEDGQTLIDPTAAAEIRQSVPLVALGTRTLRGFAEAVAVFSVAEHDRDLVISACRDTPRCPGPYHFIAAGALLDKAAAYGSGAPEWSNTLLRAPFDILMVPEAANAAARHRSFQLFAGMTGGDRLTFGISTLSPVPSR